MLHINSMKTSFLYCSVFLLFVVLLSRQLCVFVYLWLKIYVCLCLCNCVRLFVARKGERQRWRIDHSRRRSMVSVWMTSQIPHPPSGLALNQIQFTLSCPQIIILTRLSIQRSYWVVEELNPQQFLNCSTASTKQGSRQFRIFGKVGILSGPRAANDWHGDHDHEVTDGLWCRWLSSA